MWHTTVINAAEPCESGDRHTTAQRRRDICRNGHPLIKNADCDGHCGTDDVGCVDISNNLQLRL